MRLIQRLAGLARTAGASIAVACTLLAPLERARAQANNGALDLLIPIGARATAMGTAFVAEEGSEAIWWNPAGIARLARPEFAIDHLENFILKGDGISVILPVKRIGALGLAARLFNYGEVELTDSTGAPLGSSLNRSIVLAGSFATTFGPRVNAGVTYRLYQLRNDCSGFCVDQPEAASGTSAVDIGLQVRPLPRQPLRIGVQLRNLGPRLQVQDQPQADALPAQLHVGLSYDPVFKRLAPELRTSATAEMVSGVGLSDPELRVGAQLGYVAGPSMLHVRAGYVLQSSAGGASSNGPSLGLGLATGRVRLDLARIFESLSSALGKPPTFISIRVGL
jgi:hypothetical protein